ncbi:UPF0058 family protein [Haloarchaeobius sp. HRN-SO-5]|uniref:UPF0058 family protein n=1 Tax=Haloarchaeobius sp. HRN-SO-5 TaxID=3446118 RepID=UPI003EBC4DD0
MHKDELLELHEQMVTIMEFFEAETDARDEIFEQYHQLDVDPSDVHKSKSEHKHAVFVLGNALASVMSEDEFSSAGRIRKRMEELADDAESKI